MKTKKEQKDTDIAKPINQIAIKGVNFNDISIHILHATQHWTNMNKKEHSWVIEHHDNIY